jgi:hypothetical protein
MIDERYRRIDGSSAWNETAQDDNVQILPSASHARRGCERRPYRHAHAPDNIAMPMTRSNIGTIAEKLD